ncbi:MAG: PilZ domain-containing protein, partial [Candidatus Eremiobacteraeota bacterium]|nr:PilZ domain-containing protein [Candidatus Eremiobacteraeota bacterium]
SGGGRNPMMGELLAWFTGKDANRRKYPRKRKPYRATVSLDAGLSQKPAIGLDVSGGGLCVLTQEPVGKNEFEVRATIETRVVRIRAKAVWRYGMKFTGISADDWDAVIRYTTDKPVAEDTNKAQEELVTVRLTPDDASRLLPQHLQTVLLKLLVERRRLAPLQDSVTPLVQYFYSGVIRPMANHASSDDPIQGRRSEGSELFETRFIFDDKSDSIQILK